MIRHLFSSHVLLLLVSEGDLFFESTFLSILQNMALLLLICLRMDSNHTSTSSLQILGSAKFVAQFLHLTLRFAQPIIHIAFVLLDSEDWCLHLG